MPLLKEGKFLIVLIANECIEDMRLSGSNGNLCKLDLEKAYDHVDWNFSDYILGRMGFGVKWRSGFSIVLEWLISRS